MIGLKVIELGKGRDSIEVGGIGVPCFARKLEKRISLLDIGIQGCRIDCECAIGRSDCRRIISRIRSEQHTSELQSLMRISYAVFCLKTKKNNKMKENKEYT